MIVTRGRLIRENLLHTVYTVTEDFFSTFMLIVGSPSYGDFRCHTAGYIQRLCRMLYVFLQSVTTDVFRVSIKHPYGQCATRPVYRYTHTYMYIYGKLHIGISIWIAIYQRRSHLMPPLGIIFCRYSICLSAVRIRKGKVTKWLRQLRARFKMDWKELKFSLASFELFGFIRWTQGCRWPRSYLSLLYKTYSSIHRVNAP